MEMNWDNLTEGQIAAMKAFAKEVRSEGNKNDGGMNMDLEAVKDGFRSCKRWINKG